MASTAFSVRPQLFSLLLFAAELYLLEVARTRPRVALAIPLLMPVWANLHGGFAVGIGLLMVTFEHWRKGLVVAGVALVVAAVLRLLLPVRRMGFLAVRSRPVDVILLAGAGLALTIIALSIPSS